MPRKTIMDRILNAIWIHPMFNDAMNKLSPRLSDGEKRALRAKNDRAKEMYGHMNHPARIVTPDITKTINGIWMCSYGVIVGYGDTPSDAVAAFENSWYTTSGSCDKSTKGK